MDSSSGIGWFIESVRWPLIVLYGLNVALVSTYGLHMLWLTVVYLRQKRRAARPAPADRRSRRVIGAGEEPVVTVQLPLFNEGDVGARVIRACCAIDWPRERLEVQVLDDSTDEESRRIVDESVRAMREEGFDVSLMRRGNRRGFKAGALAIGTDVARGEYLAIFDADFVPQADFLRRLIGFFDDDEVGMVQARWGHLNAESSLLTRCQRMFIDGHFIIEQGARSMSGWLINFNGTAGIWRRRCIHDSGGWTQRTLSEDLDLSYRAQLRGWKMVYDAETVAPAELPDDMRAYKIQQRRWNKGTMECCKLLLGDVWRADLPFWTKIEATVQLGRPVLQFWLVAMVLLAFPASLTGVLTVQNAVWSYPWIMVVLLCVLSTSASTIFYLVAARATGENIWKALATCPALIAVGVGISISNAWAVGEAIMGRATAFVRTPKSGAGAGAMGVALAPVGVGGPMPAMTTGGGRSARGLRIGRVRIDRLVALESLMAAYLLACVAVSYSLDGGGEVAPFLLLFGAGFAWSAAGSAIAATSAG